MTTTPQAEAEAEAGTGAGGTRGVAVQLSELVLKTARYDDMAAFYDHVLGHGPFCERTPLSRQTTLEPGDVISTGTPAGVGHGQGLLRLIDRAHQGRRSSRRNGAVTTRFRQATEDTTT